MDQFLNMLKGKENAQIYIPSLPNGTLIYMTTLNSFYEISVVNALESEVLVSGGYYKKRGLNNFSTRVEGSTMGGSMIVQHRLVIDFYCEFSNHILTSRILNLFPIFSN